jgi:hypothetical protein
VIDSMASILSSLLMWSLSTFLPSSGEKENKRKRA